MMFLLDRRSVRVGYRVVTARWIRRWNATTVRWNVGGLLTVDEGEVEVVVR
jgi:hypothetical protein